MGIVRSFKGFVPQIAAEEHGHLVLIRKSLIKELTEDPATLPALVLDPFASRVFHTLLRGISPKVLAPWQVMVLDVNRDPEAVTEASGPYYSKKEPALILSQNLASVADALLAAAAQVAPDALADPTTSPLIVELLTGDNDVINPLDSARNEIASAILSAVLPFGDEQDMDVEDDEDEEDEDDEEEEGPHLSKTGLIADYKGSRALQSLIRASSA